MFYDFIPMCDVITIVFFIVLVNGKGYNNNIGHPFHER